MRIPRILLEEGCLEWVANSDANSKALAGIPRSSGGQPRRPGTNLCKPPRWYFLGTAYLEYLSNSPTRGRADSGTGTLPPRTSWRETSSPYIDLSPLLSA